MGVRPTPAGRDKPGPTKKPLRAGNTPEAGHTPHTLWGRLYAGQRASIHAMGVRPTAAGRDKPSPTKTYRGHENHAGSWPYHALGGGGLMPARGMPFPPYHQNPRARPA